ncbi:MAG TPA: T9SS type A sorting domain-containing protein [Chitinophagales bacterium]|nr:T9SS type A sorting domain-containing protein [Chitinophagales bacterium]
MNLTATSLLILLCSSADAQTFLNGNFETTSGAACDYNLPNATFTSKMSNCYGYGAGNEIDIMSNCAPYCTSAQSGTHYVAVANSSGSTPDAFTMQLSAPLISGASYTISFWDHGDNSLVYQPTPIQIGVSTTNGATGTIVYTGPTPAYGLWKKRTFTFVAPNNGQYISVSATTLRWTQIDNFVMTAILPIQLISFSGEAKNDKVMLNWNTASELNNAYFTIGRSDDGTSFIPIITEKGAGVSTQSLSYLAYDLHPLQGKNFYRLSQTDYNGTTIVFQTIEVTMGNPPVKIPTLFPNPTSGVVHIENIDPSLACSITVSNLLGQEVEKLNEIPEAVLDLRSLRRGIYLLRIQQEGQCWCDYLVKE